MKNRVAAFKSWYKPSWSKGKSWEDNAQGSAGGSGYAQGWRTGSSKRAYSAPARKSKKKKEHQELDLTKDPIEAPFEWRDIGEANLDPAFLYAETEDSPCPINKNFRKNSTEAAAEYMLWIPVSHPECRQEGRESTLPQL